MKIKKVTIILFCIGCFFVGVAASCGSPYMAGVSVQPMTGIPDEEAGFSLGVSACYAGMIGNRMIMAGGCNFPETPAAEGGKKRFYKGIYAAELTSSSLLQWHKVGELPEPAAYGVSMSIPNGLVLAGGVNADGSLSSVYRLLFSEDGQSITLDTLCSLPFTMDNMSGASTGKSLFLMGGNVNGKPSSSLYSLDYTRPDNCWVQEATFPGEARIQSVCVAQNVGEVQVYVWGGFAPSVDGKAATLSTDGYCYLPEKRIWRSVSVPVDKDFETVSLGGGIGYALDDSTIVCTGGVNKDIFLSALYREEMLKKAIVSSDSGRIDSLKTIGREYMIHSPEFYQFNDKILVYNTRQNVWVEAGRTSAVARAGAAIVGNGRTFYSICGELKPGIRTPEINKIVLGLVKFPAKNNN